MVTLRWCFLDWFMMWLISAIYLNVPLIPVIKPFWWWLSINWLLIEYVKTLFRSNDVHIFKRTGSKVIGLKFWGKLRSLFLWIKMVVTLVYCAGRVFKVLQCKYLTWMILSIDIAWSKLSISGLTVKVEPEGFMSLIIRVISC